jgi:hypothetical protein
MNGLDQSNCILCFITKKYSQSDNCKRELSFALEKPHAILMLEHFDIIEKAVQFNIKIDSRLNFYLNKEKPSMWFGEEYEKLLKTISPYINKSSSHERPISSKQISQERPTSSKQVSKASSKTETTSICTKKSYGKFRVK